MSALSSVLAARSRLSTLTPLKTDCGRLCAGACCQGDEVTGMLLFPGEEALYETCGFAKIVPADYELGGRLALLLVCRGHCPREERPLSCRLFPLFLRFGPDGRTRVRMDARARALCPLTGYGLSALDPAFVSAAREAYNLLLADESCARFLGELSRAYEL